MSSIAIAGRQIGNFGSPIIVAEISGNHNGSLDHALKLIGAAAVAGADAVKLQSYTPETMTIRSNRPEFVARSGPWAGRELFELYAQAHTPFEWHPALFAEAKRRGIRIFSSPFDASAVEMLAALDACAFKISSFELVDLQLIRAAARHGKPLIISTGMATRAEIAEAVHAAQAGGADGVALLHCTSAYPTPSSDANLRTIPSLVSEFGLPVGLSDHTIGRAVATAAVALGAAIIEKHFTLSRADGGPDAGFSLEPYELRLLVQDCREAHAALGKAVEGPQEVELPNVALRRSLYVVRAVSRGDRITSEMVRSIRPAGGLAPKHLEKVLSMYAARNISAGEPLDFGMLEER